jgi:hypothetical protein
VLRLLAQTLRGVALRWPLLLGLLSACTGPHKLISARHTACKPREILISELTYSGSDEDWKVSCRGRNYRCHTREQGHRLLYGCKLSEAPQPAQTDAGAR